MQLDGCWSFGSMCTHGSLFLSLLRTRHIFCLPGDLSSCWRSVRTVPQMQHMLHEHEVPAVLSPPPVNLMPVVLKTIGPPLLVSVNQQQALQSRNMEPSLWIVAVGSVSPNYEYPKPAYSRKVRGRLAEALFYFLRGS